MSAALVLVMLAAGCQRHARTSARADDDASGPWPQGPADGFAVLPWGSRVYVEPQVGAPSTRLGRALHAAPPWPVGGLVVKVLGQRDGFVAVAPLPSDGTSHCEPRLVAEGLDVSVYVSPWALATVLSRPLTAEHEGGGAVSLRPGAVVRPIPGERPDRYGVWAAGIRLRATLPPDAVGVSYPEPQLIRLPDRREWELPVEAPIVDGEGWPVKLDQNIGHDVAVESVLPVAEDYRIELVSPCARLTGHGVRSPPRQRGFQHFDFGLGAEPTEIPDDGALRPSMLVGIEAGPANLEEPPEPRFHFPDEPDIMGELEPPGSLGLQGSFVVAEVPELIFEAGAPIYLTTAGPAAGSLSEMRVFSESAWLVGDRLCFPTSFGENFDPMIEVCFDAAEARLRSDETNQHDFGAGTVQPESLRVSRGLDEAAVARALRLHRRHLRRCYDEALARNASVQGALTLVLDTDGDGMVTNARLRSDWLGPVVECALAAAREWAMPPTRDGKAGRITFTVQLERR